MMNLGKPFMFGIACVWISGYLIGYNNGYNTCYTYRKR